MIMKYIMMHIYQFDMGMASAQAWVLFTVVGGLSLVAFVSQKKWVYYSDEDGGR